MSRLRLHHSSGTGRCRPASGGTRRPPRVVPGPQDPGASRRGRSTARLQGRCPGQDRAGPSSEAGRRWVGWNTKPSGRSPGAPAPIHGSRPAACWRARCRSIAWASAGPGRRCRRRMAERAVRAAGGAEPGGTSGVRRWLRTRVLDAGGAAEGSACLGCCSYGRFWTAHPAPRNQGDRPSRVLHLAVPVVVGRFCDCPTGRPASPSGTDPRRSAGSERS
jgi:hypothetical protein